MHHTPERCYAWLLRPDPLAACAVPAGASQMKEGRVLLPRQSGFPASQTTGAGGHHQQGSQVGWMESASLVRSCPV